MKDEPYVGMLVIWNRKRDGSSVIGSCIDIVVDIDIPTKKVFVVRRFFDEERNILFETDVSTIEHWIGLCDVEIIYPNRERDTSNS